MNVCSQDSAVEDRLGLKAVDDLDGLFRQMRKHPFKYFKVVAGGVSQQVRKNDREELATIYSIASSHPNMAIHSEDDFERLLERLVGSVAYSKSTLDIFTVNSFYLQEGDVYDGICARLKKAGDIEYEARLLKLQPAAERLREAVKGFRGRLRLVLQPVRKEWIENRWLRMLKPNRVKKIWRQCIRGQAAFFREVSEGDADVRVFLGRPPTAARRQFHVRRILATDQEVFSQLVSEHDRPGMMSPLVARWIES